MYNNVEQWLLLGDVFMDDFIFCFFFPFSVLYTFSEMAMCYFIISHEKWKRKIKGLLKIHCQIQSLKNIVLTHLPPKGGPDI